jgi:2-hydroxy-3-keto-5-methylthiopentenyl-1-phosphate phosphatase
MSCHVLVDFDGTLVPGDATDSLLERFAPPEWREVEALWQSGRIASRDCLARQVALIRATPAQFDAAVDGIAIDPGFRSFMRLCSDYGITASVASDGYDRVIGRILFNHGIVMGYTANHLEPFGGDHWRITFPNAGEDCRARAGHCKCATAERQSTGFRIVIGDGRSDLCVADGADLVFAKGSLGQLCSQRGIAHTAVRDFADVTAALGAWLRTQRFVPRRDRNNGAATFARSTGRSAASTAMPTEP